VPIRKAILDPIRDGCTVQIDEHGPLPHLRARFREIRNEHDENPAT
jgi:hypothetical protein